MAGVQGATTGAPGGLLGHPGVDDVPSEQVRFAVVLNGGVSLAVWMGGVVLEIDRLTKAPRAGTGAYSILKRLTGCHARADVITGTSAGGINGAALALTQVNRGADPAMLRDLWIDQGRLETLLRQPFRGQPTSLLRGDEYFLPQLNAALSLLAKPDHHWRPPSGRPIDLTITTTVISGNQAVSVDSMGQRLPQRLHAGRFRLQRPAGVAGADDPFSETQPRPHGPPAGAGLPLLGQLPGRVRAVVRPGRQPRPPRARAATRTSADEVRLAARHGATTCAPGAPAPTAGPVPLLRRRRAPSPTPPPVRRSRRSRGCPPPARYAG